MDLGSLVIDCSVTMEFELLLSTLINKVDLLPVIAGILSCVET